MKKAIILSGILIFAMGCKYFGKNRAAQDERVIARVYDEFLFLSDVQPLVQGVSQEDSAKLIASYAESWVKKKLLYKKAQEYMMSGGSIDVIKQKYSVSQEVEVALIKSI